MSKSLSLTGKQWISRGEGNSSQTLLQNFLTIRGIPAEDLKNVSFSDLLDPFLFRDMRRAVDVVEETIAQKKRILIFGDYDLDGMSGAAQLFLTLKLLGAEVSFRLPAREDGYGLSLPFVEEAIANRVSLFITTDCGISNALEMSRFTESGGKVIITDHHTIPENIPEASAILHPLLFGETFPDPHLTGAGVAYFFCSALLQNRFGKKDAQKMEEELLELAVLGTIADCGKLHGENRKIVLLGLHALSKTRNEGLKKLFELSGTDPDLVTAETIAFFIAPRLNASGRLAHPRLSLELLLGNGGRAEELGRLNTERQKMVEGFMADIVLGLPADFLEVCLVQKSPQWPSGIIGLLSGQLAERYHIPVVMMEERADKLVGSCRGPEDFHFGDFFRIAKEEYPNLFMSAGGHGQAAGCSMKPESFEQFCAVLREAVRTKRGDVPPCPRTFFDGVVSRRISVKEISELKKGEPYGVGNPPPVFCFARLLLKNIRTVGARKTHLSFFFSSPYGENISGIFFQQGALADVFVTGKQYDILATPEVKMWQGEEQLSFKMVDIRESEEMKKKN
ncbi:MAG: DHH family phosphoesterase [Candidatus Peregrinibacteria bacterium]